MPTKNMTYTYEEIMQHCTEDSIWVVIDNGVYDVTNFLKEHPGGPEPLLDWAGREATDAFEDIGHSSDARALMKDFRIGDLAVEVWPSGEDEKSETEEKSSCFSAYFLIPIGVAVGAFLAYKLYSRMSK